MHREPQPQKLYTIETDLPLRTAAEGALPRALAARPGGDRLGRPGGRRRGDPALRRAPPPARNHRVPARAELDRRPELPARVSRAAARPWLAEHAAELDEATREQAAATRCARSTTSRRSRRRCRRCCARRRRSATRSATRAASTSPRCGATSTPTASPTSSSRRSSAASTTTRARPGSSSAPRAASTSTLSGGGRYDGLAEELGGPPTPGVGFGAGIERLLLAIEQRARRSPGPTASTSSSLLDGGRRPRRRARRDDGAARATGLSCRHRLRRALAQGPAHPGRRAGREATVVGEGDAPARDRASLAELASS